MLICGTQDMQAFQFESLKIKTSPFIITTVSFSVVLQTVGEKCGDVERVTDTVISSWPQISSMISQLDEIYRDLQPILSFLDDVQDMLNERVCLPNPVELLSESAEELSESELVEEGLRFAAERAREAEAFAAETAREVDERADEGLELAEELREGLCFFCKRRKRSLRQKKSNSEDKSGSAIRISKDRANSMLTVRSKRASNLCLR